MVNNSEVFTQHESEIGSHMLLVSEVVVCLNISMSMLKPATCRKYVVVATYQSNIYVNPNIVGMHKCLVSNIV